MPGSNPTFMEKATSSAADVLFLSTKTVQYHLTRVYAKLDIRSRAELAALRRTS